MLRLRTIFGLSTFTAFFLVGCSGPDLSSGIAGTASHPSEPAPAKATRPILVSKSGGYFSWTAPEGWKSQETSNGVDLTSSDGKMGASSAVLIGSSGETDPWRFLNWALGAAGFRQIEKLSEESLPSQPSGYPGNDYEVKAFVITYTDKDGFSRQAEVTVGICNVYGASSAAFQMYWSEPAEFKKAKTWLPMLADDVRPLDASRLGNHNTVLMPRNHPLDDSSIMESWQARRDSQDRIDQMQHETTMGYERMTSSNGSHYNMPFELYDPKIGGYRDPADPNQAMKHAPPGE